MTNEEIQKTVEFIIRQQEGFAEGMVQFARVAHNKAKRA